MIFTVYGTPQPAGSKRGFFIKKLNRVVITDAAKQSRPWKALVSDAAQQAMNGGGVMRGPLSLRLAFFVPRPKGHMGKHGIKPSAPGYPAVRPDATKLLRAVEDALTGILWNDDAQVVEQHVFKHYGEPARCEVKVELL